MWAVPPQPCSQSGKRRWFSCTTAAPCGPFGAQPSASGNLIASRQAHFSTITRLPSGSSTSHSGAFRDGVLGLRGRYCPPMHGRVWRHSSHPRSARDVSFGVSLLIHSHLCGLWFRVEYHPSPYPRTSAASAQSRLAQRLKCTCAAGIRLANERSEELCEAKSQEPAPHG
jgi:hypothetical protein